LVSPISPLGVVEQYYSETYTIGSFTIAWRPGAFPAARAQEVAQQAETGLAEVNAFLHIDDPGEITVYLADRMFDENCRGCQGFAASDLSQVFILQDGSVAADEVQSLLTHEIGHVLAGNHIALPNSLFFAEGFATVLMDADVQAAGYVPSLQTAAWAYKAGVLPSLDFLLHDATYDGRVRKRLEYDGAASFSRFFIDTYGLETYESLYTMRDPEQVLGVSWDDLEQHWHQYLGQWSDNVINGVDGIAWWNVAQGVTAGFGTLYENPDTVSVDSYARLTVARLALFRLDLPTAVRYANESHLAPQTAT
jgi:hypothetical protein